MVTQPESGASQPAGSSPAIGPRAMPRIEIARDVAVVAPCSCLPESVGEDWRACASCGLQQAPGKTFCSYCGSRWVAAPDGDPTAGTVRTSGRP